MKARDFIIMFLLNIGLGFVFLNLYEWIGEIKVLSIFLPINESAFESAKAVFYPIIITGLICRMWLKNVNNYAIYLSICSIIGAFALLLISSPFIVFDYFNLYVIYGVMVVSSIIAQFVFMRLMQRKSESFPVGKFESIFTAITFAFSFAVFTFYPPDILLFYCF